MYFDRNFDDYAVLTGDVAWPPPGGLAHRSLWLPCNNSNVDMAIFAGAGAPKRCSRPATPQGRLFVENYLNRQQLALSAIQ
jgi:hypothetical protein